MDIFTLYISVMIGLIFSILSFIGINELFDKFNQSGWVRPFIKNRIIASLIIGFASSYLIFS